MNRYPIRAIKYFIWLLLLFIVVFIIMNITNTSQVRGLEGFTQMMVSRKGPMLIFAILALSLLYPLVGFMKREIKGNIEKENIVQVMKDLGYNLRNYKGESMVFTARNPMRKLSMYFEDRIEIICNEQGITIDGIRKEVFKVEYRLTKFLLSKED